MTVWMPVQAALRDPAVSADDKLAIGAACIEEEALMRTARVLAGTDQAPAWYITHGGRFRFSADGEHLMIEIPVRPPVVTLWDRPVTRDEFVAASQAEFAGYLDEISQFAEGTPDGPAA